MKKELGLSAQDNGDIHERKFYDRQVRNEDLNYALLLMHYHLEFIL